jgi:hypothetical protein
MCAGPSARTIYRVIDRLLKSGFVVEVEPSGKKPNGQKSPRKLGVLAHKEWMLRHPGECRKLQENRWHNRQQPATAVTTEPVTKLTATSVSSANGPVTESTSAIVTGGVKTVITENINKNKTVIKEQPAGGNSGDREPEEVKPGAFHPEAFDPETPQSVCHQTADVQDGTPHHGARPNDSAPTSADVSDALAAFNVELALCREDATRPSLALYRVWGKIAYRDSKALLPYLKEIDATRTREAQAASEEMMAA